MTHVLFAVWCFAVAVAGGVAGLVLGNIRLPAALAIASSPAAGAGANIGISAVSAATAAIAHIRAGRVNWRLFAWLLPPSVVGAVAGGLISGALSRGVLLAIIGAVLVLFGIDLLRSKPPAGEPRQGGRAVTLGIGFGVGLLGGLVGLILGSLRMPALIRWLGEPPTTAIGTNMATGFWVGLAGVIGHTPGGVDWGLLAIGAGASIPGALLGARLTGRLSQRVLLKAVGGILVVAGCVTFAQAL